MNKKYNTAAQRLRQDYLRLARDPVPYIIAHPLPSNILEWHYVVRGPENTPYENGIYHGKLMFPAEFPFKPPSILMITPSGRFKCNTRLCLSISDFHPDSWNPAWSVATILTGLLSFMVEKNPTLGSIDTTDREDIKDQISKRNAEVEAQSAYLAEQRSLSGSSMAEQGYGFLGSTLTNIFVIVGFAAFAYTVKYVLTFSAK
ncbi:hypothetical protein HPB47_027213 [Ixodes persulcatus]|uniref:Uncharacterized protein n=1 Tax=Ixodes persulcatus TaxID=34615 RepID=A0AC60PWI9_IXOPE|nr:hypothetical protein HPB47_027213 [Ixodes persulcatus]